MSTVMPGWWPFAVPRAMALMSFTVPHLTGDIHSLSLPSAMYAKQQRKLFSKAVCVFTAEIHGQQRKMLKWPQLIHVSCLNYPFLWSRSKPVILLSHGICLRATAEDPSYPSVCKQGVLTTRCPLCVLIFHAGRAVVQVSLQAAHAPVLHWDPQHFLLSLFLLWPSWCSSLNSMGWKAVE